MVIYQKWGVSQGAKATTRGLEARLAALEAA